MKLRKWQQECSNEALTHYLTNNKHFFCLATPGAGKSVMAADVAKSLINHNKIDHILCFAPSTNIANGLKQTFSKYLNASFNGYLGDLGASYTYQSLPYFDKEFWNIFLLRNVLVVFDEIHHCAGNSESDSNVWGEEIITNIQDKASYTLALSGTPWRSDNLPITLAPYNFQKTSVACNYVYGMSEAIMDNVCKIPNILLIDNQNIEIQSESNVIDAYSSFIPFLKDTNNSYKDILHNKDAMEYILKRGSQILSEIREKTPQAAGLIVANSVNHAILLAKLLKEKFNKTAVLVSYKDKNAQNKIAAFKHSNEEWIVSIGMISEGTDIPRLQVCCLLSNIKTELYFRQVLGRILRINNKHSKEAWLLTFNEESLSKYSHRITEEIPEHKPIVLKETISIDSKQSTKLALTIKGELQNHSEANYGDLLFSELALSSDQFKDTELSVLLLGKYQEQVIKLFS